MAGFVNKTYDNSDPIFTYDPLATCWDQITSQAPNFFNNTYAYANNSDCNPRFTFVFPEPAIAFYFYGGFYSANHHYIWTDVVPANDNHETVGQFMGNDTAEEFISTLLYVKRFDQPGLHTITIGGPSQISVDRVDLELPLNNGAATKSGTTISTTSVSTFVPASPNLTSGEKVVPINAVVGGTIGGLGVLLLIFSMWFLCRRRWSTNAHMGPAGATHPFTIMSHTGTSNMSQQRTNTTGRIAALISKRSEVVRRPQAPGIPPSLGQRGDIRQREVDAGPVGDENGPTGETLPPDYEQVFRVPAAPTAGLLEGMEQG